MNYIAAITTLFQCSSHRLSERSKVLDVDFDFAVTSLPKYEQITELIESFPQRDIVTLSLINENDDLFYIVIIKVFRRWSPKSLFNFCSNFLIIIFGLFI